MQRGERGNEMTTTKQPTDRELRTAKINKLHKQHPGTRRQRSSHGAGKYSVQFFDKTTGKLVADYNV
jgi:hypothetical protein